MDGTRRSTFNALLTLTKDYLTAGLNLSAERVFRGIRPVSPKALVAKADQYVVLRPGGATVDGEWADSEGRLATTVKRELIVEPYYRLATDTFDVADNIAQVLLAREDQIVNLLQIWEPEDALEPYHFLGISPEEGRDVVPGWAWSSMRFSVRFLQDVGQGLQ